MKIKTTDFVRYLDSKNIYIYYHLFKQWEYCNKYKACMYYVNFKDSVEHYKNKYIGE